MPEGDSILDTFLIYYFLSFPLTPGLLDSSNPDFLFDSQQDVKDHLKVPLIIAVVLFWCLQNNRYL